MNQKTRREKKFRGFLWGVLVLIVVVVVLLVMIIQFIRPENERADQFGKNSACLLYNQADFRGMKRQDLRAIVREAGEIPVEEQNDIFKQNLKNAQAKLSVYREPGQRADRKAYSRLNRAGSHRSLRNEALLLNYNYNRQPYGSPVVEPVAGSFRDRGKYTTFLGRVYNGVSISAKAAEKLEAGDRLRLPVKENGKRMTFHVKENLVVNGDGKKFQNCSLKQLGDGRYYLFLQDGSRYNVYYDKVRFYALRGAMIGTRQKQQEIDATVLNLAKNPGSYDTVIFDRKGYVTGIYNFKD